MENTNKLFYGLSSVKISGLFNEFYREKNNVSTFEMYVSPITGILLYLEEKDIDGNVIAYIKNEDLTIELASKDIIGSYEKISKLNYQIEIPAHYEKDIDGF